MTEDTDTPAAQRPVPAVSPAVIPRSDFLPPQKRSRFRTSSFLMWLFGVIAVVLIATGIAAPQVTYALDVDRYDDTIAELSGLQTAVAEMNESVASSEVLLNRQQVEAGQLVERLESLAADPAVFGADDAGLLQEAAAQLAGQLPKTPLNAESQHVAAVEQAIEEDPATAPSTWFVVSPAVAGALAGIETDLPEEVTSEQVVTREIIAETKQRLEEVRESLVSVEERHAELTEELDALGAHAARAFDTVTDVGERLPARAEAIAEETSEQIEARARMVAAAAQAEAAAKAEEFVRQSDGSLVLDEAGAADGAGETRIEADPALRTVVVLERLAAFAGFAATVLDEQKLIEEAEEEARLIAEQEARWAAEEEARRIAEENARIAADEEARRIAEEEARRAEEQAQNGSQEAPPETPETPET
ncbi:hypothetical protein [Leucobacter triazinivorans]|uniref:Uncharacterized protein n=1 Tax=Leucobacter triazinivorans TaxID=1784719 RepID=A0A4P6KFC4_9MICO|nr:hypothetical protein [Leucobacter triazinivorans]QBE48638.1 hypothetical protein EVS81_07180 [Leucobacter triazinivorans]